MLRSVVARMLERGLPTFVPAPVRRRFTADALARPLAPPACVRVVCVGGATLGGSGKTRVAIAVTRALAARGLVAALVGHAYRARLRTARRVGSHDRLVEVGDEALVAARELDGIADVVVGPSRGAAVALAASRGARVVVLDGPLQTRPHRAALSLLAVDADEPWGSGVVVPSGDLRSDPADLVAAADVVVPVDASPRRARIGARPVRLDELCDARVGLFTAIARPRRLVRALAAAGVRPVVHVAAADHGPVSSSAARAFAAADVDVWLATAKCMIHLEDARLVGRPGGRDAPAVAELDGAIALPPSVNDALDRLACGRPRTRGALTASDVPP